MSVLENITLPHLQTFSTCGWLHKRKEQKRVAQYVDTLRIKTPSIEHKVKYLSGGNQQKVVLAKWMISRSKVLIFDEPTLGVDVGAKVEIYQLMNELVRKGTAIIMISSYLPEILAMSDRILVMCRGRITKELLREEATEEKILYYAALGLEHA